MDIGASAEWMGSVAGFLEFSYSAISVVIQSSQRIQTSHCMLVWYVEEWRRLYEGRGGASAITEVLLQFVWKSNNLFLKNGNKYHVYVIDRYSLLLLKLVCKEAATEIIV